MNYLVMGGSLWQKDSLVTFILFELCLFKHFSPVANFGYQSLYLPSNMREPKILGKRLGTPQPNCTLPTYGKSAEKQGIFQLD